MESFDSLVKIAIMEIQMEHQMDHEMEAYIGTLQEVNELKFCYSLP